MTGQTTAAMTADEMTWRALLAAHAFGLVAIGVRIQVDVARNATAASPVYAAMTGFVGHAWGAVPLLAGLAILGGLVLGRWAMLATGLVTCVLWYTFQVGLFVAAYVTAPNPVMFPVLVYALLAVTAGIHLVRALDAHRHPTLA